MSGVNFSSEPVQPSEIDQIRRKIDSSFKRLAEVISSARRPLPTHTGDGTYTEYQDDPPEVIAKIEAGLKDLASLGIKDVHTLLQVAHRQKHSEMWDDKRYLMERLIQTAARFPDNSATGKKVTDGFLKTLYNDLDHPPMSYLGKDYFYRQPDGSFNSLKHPKLGAADTPYARTVAPKSMQPGALPNAEDIFDSVMVRKHTEPHPNKISSMLFYLASIIIHDLFRTDHQNMFNSKTSSYLDLSPLYGSNLKEQLQMRTRFDGKLKADCFSESRLLLFPPGVGAILIMFNRFHNSVAETLARINQGGQFKKPKGDVPKGEWPTIDRDAFDPKNPEDKKAQYPEEWRAWYDYDHHLFNTARLITCGLYINIILIDYVRTILNLNKTNYNWALDPRADMPDVEVASGNQVSAEFNLVYRWHSTISARDEKWLEDLWSKMFDGLDPKTANWHDFVVKAGAKEKSSAETPPNEREFAGLKRQADGKYPDDALVEILASSIEDCANSYGANRVPAVMRVIEVLGIQQARAWSVASLNEFRKYFGLQPHKTFESINPDPYVADQLRHLYEHPDYVELYTGLVTEEAKKPTVPGSGLCPSYTVSRAVLSDAVALVRGDRFYTIDYHPKKLTNWGFSEAASDVAVNNGCVFYKLFMHSFPQHFAPNSVYAHYPMTIPSEMQSVLKTLEREKNFSFKRPGRMGALKVVSSHAACKQMLSQPDIFQPNAEGTLVSILGEQAKPAMSAAASAKNKKTVEEAIYISGKWEGEVRKYYENITAKLLKDKAYTLAKRKQVDIVRDIGNIAQVHFASEMWALPLKTKETPLGIFTEQELFLIMQSIYTSVHFDADPTLSYSLLQKSKSAISLLGELVLANITEISAGGLFSKLFSAIWPHDSPLPHYGINLIKRLLQEGIDPKSLTYGHILGATGAMTANQGMLFAQILEFYLNEGKGHLADIQKLAADDSDAAFAKLLRYVLEGARLAGEAGQYRTVTKACEIKDGSRVLKLAVGDRVLLNLCAASRDPAIFPKPDAVDLTRPLGSYIVLGEGKEYGIGNGIVRVALTAMLKTVGKLKGLRPVTGPQGMLYKVDVPYVEGGEKPEGMKWFHAYLSESHDRLGPFPQTMRVTWD